MQLDSRYGCVETIATDIHPSTDATGAGSGFIQFRDDIAHGHPGRLSRGQRIRAITHKSAKNDSEFVGRRRRMTDNSVGEKVRSSGVARVRLRR